MNKFFRITQAAYIITTFCIMLTWASCKVEKVSPVEESVKDISGSWKVVKATRNGTDLTNLVDFTQFRIKFDALGNYSLLNKLPFVINNDGKFSFDDPQYPFKITFNAPGSQTVNTSFNYPVVGGVRQLNMVFSPGCTLNSYNYILVKE